MNEKLIRFILFYQRTSTYAFNVLVGALEFSPLFPHLEILFITKEKSLIDSIQTGIKNNQKVIVGWSFFSTEFIEFSSVIQRVKSIIPNPSVMHILGGVHATAEPILSLEVGFDFVSIGEGEKTVIELFNRLIHNKEITKIKGISYLKDGHYIANGSGEQIDLNDFPPFSIHFRKFNPIEITRGCIYACKFCQTPFMFKAKFRHRTVENICHYVQFLKDQGMTDIRFISPTSMSYGSSDESIHLEKIEELLFSVRKIIGKKGRLFFGTFPSEIRPEHITKEGLHILKQYVDNDNIIIGGQTGSEDLLKSSHRGHSVDDIYRAVHLTKEAGFIPNVDFIFGLPGETQKDINESLKFADKLVSLGARIHGHTFMPLPGTPYKNSPPGIIHPSTLKQLHSLESKGALYGQWHKQISISKNLSNRVE